jgi:hypothetical protein
VRQSESIPSEIHIPSNCAADAHVCRLTGEAVTRGNEVLMDYHEYDQRFAKSDRMRAPKHQPFAINPTLVERGFRDCAKHDSIAPILMSS